MMKHWPSAAQEIKMENEGIVILTDKAITQVQKIMETTPPEKGFGLRVGVIGGGCSGLSYSIEFSEKKESDNVFEYGNFILLVDPKSGIYLKGTTIDFKDGLNDKGFVFVNPNADNTCGCGESFSI